MDEMKIGEARERLQARHLVSPDPGHQTDLLIRLAREMVVVTGMKLGTMRENFQAGYLIYVDWEDWNDLQILLVLVDEMKLGEMEGVQIG